MLVELKVRNLALIEEASLLFGEGFNVLSGETGAGKSIILSAIQLLFGGKGRASLIRKGAKEVQVEGLIRIRQKEVAGEVERALGAALDEGSLILKRTYDCGGKSRYSINGEMALARLVKEIGKHLVDLHGQHDFQSLMVQDTQTRILDTYGKLDRKRESFEAEYQKLRSFVSRKEALQKGREERSKLRDLYSFQIEELDRANLQEGESEALDKERALFEQAEKIKSTLEAGYFNLYEAEPSVLGNLRDLVSQVEEIVPLHKDFESLFSSLEDAILRVEDSAYTFRGLKEKVVFDPQRLDEVQARLHQLQRLSQKYGGTEEDLLGQLKNLKGELQSVEESNKDEASLNSEIEKAAARLFKAGEELARRREASGKRLSRLVEQELKELSLPAARFVVSQTMRCNRADPEQLLQQASPSGISRLEFCISTNSGEDPKPLSQIASGGEMSRIMLALKGKLALEDQIPIQIFDEIDANVGARMGKVIGQKLLSLSRKHQVLCVTHLAQIACFADKHLKVEKTVSQKRTFIGAREIKGEERVKEIAEMIKGKSMSAITMKQAKEMLTESRSIKVSVKNS